MVAAVLTFLTAFLAIRAVLANFAAARRSRGAIGRSGIARGRIVVHRPTISISAVVALTGIRVISPVVGNPRGVARSLNVNLARDLETLSHESDDGIYGPLPLLSAASHPQFDGNDRRHGCHRGTGYSRGRCNNRGRCQCGHCGGGGRGHSAEGAGVAIAEGAPVKSKENEKEKEKEPEDKADDPSSLGSQSCGRGKSPDMSRARLPWFDRAELYVCQCGGGEMRIVCKRRDVHTIRSSLLLGDVDKRRGQIIPFAR